MALYNVVGLAVAAAANKKHQGLGGRVCMRAILTFLLFLMVTANGNAQEKVGSSMVGGKLVDLYSDKTWDYRVNVDPGCIVIKYNIKFCDHDSKWTASPFKAWGISKQFQFDDKHYAQYIVEKIGLDDGFNITLIQKLSLQAVAQQSGISSEGLVIFEAQENEFGGHAASTVVYGVTVNNLTMTIMNTFVVTKDKSVQIMTYALAAQPDDQQRALHEDFRTKTRID